MNSHTGISFIVPQHLPVSAFGSSAILPVRSQENRKRTSPHTFFGRRQKNVFMLFPSGGHTTNYVDSIFIYIYVYIGNRSVGIMHILLPACISRMETSASISRRYMKHQEQIRTRLCHAECFRSSLKVE